MRHELLTQLQACGDAREWAAKYPTLGEAWKHCERAEAKAILEQHKGA